ncbi:Neuron navigator 3 [Taenia solium]|eukprot:TsM_000278400 transcript=TsM_000278400 gene=TsM_000278400
MQGSVCDSLRVAESRREDTPKFIRKMCAMRGFRKASPMLSKGSASQLQYNPLKKLPEVDQQHHHQQQQQEQQQPLLQTLSTPQKYRVSPMDLMRPVKTKAETVSLYTEWANHYLQKAGYECFITDLQNDLRDGKMLINLTHAVGKY